MTLEGQFFGVKSSDLRDSGMLTIRKPLIELPKDRRTNLSEEIGELRRVSTSLTNKIITKEQWKNFGISNVK